VHSRNKEFLREKALSLLELKPRTRKELEDILGRKFNRSDVKSIIKELAGSGLVDDSKYAESWIENQLKKKPAGKATLVQRLIIRGIERKTAEQAIEKVMSGKNEIDLAKIAAGKQIHRYAGLDSGTAKRRVFQFLLRQGFDCDTAGEVSEKVTLCRHKSSAFQIF